MASSATPRRGAGARRLARSSAEQGAAQRTAAEAAESSSYEISAADLEAAKWLEYTIEKGLLSGFPGDDRLERPTSR